MHKSIPTQRLVLVIGLGLAAVTGLLCWAGRRAFPVQASGHPAAAAPPAGHSAIAASWTSTTPVTTTMDSDGGTWYVEGHPVTITFPVGSLTGPAVFTFTPLTGHSSSPLARSSYFFDLRGVNTWNGRPISVGEYDIALQYDPGELNGALEDSLRMYNFDVFYARWESQATSVDKIDKVVYCTTRDTGLFALGGYSDQVFLPLVLRDH